MHDQMQCKAEQMEKGPSRDSSPVLCSLKLGQLKLKSLCKQQTLRRIFPSSSCVLFMRTISG